MKHTSEDHLSVLDQNQKDMEADLDRRDNTPELSNWRAARELKGHFQVIKAMSGDEWQGLYAIQGKSGFPVPKELDQQFTSPDLALHAIKTYLNKEPNTNVTD
jgi:hypothetical protein